jgi:PAS domain S-box-containing protein
MEAARETALGEHGNDLDVLSLHTLVLDRMSEGVSVSDESGYILYTNAAEDRMFGYERGELIGKHVTVQNAYPEDVNRRIVADVIATLRSSGEWKGEWLNRKKDGSAFHTQARISALRQGGRSYWVCVQEDITERRVAETELREANQKLSALIGSSPLPIVAFGRDGLIDMWNPAAERVFGWTEAEVVGKPLPFIPSDRAAEHRTMREQDLSGQGFTNRELRRMRKDGTPIDISVSTAPMFDGSGQVSGVMSVYLDITERKRAADEQRLNVERLELLERQLTLLVEASGALLASPESAQVLRTDSRRRAAIHTCRTHTPSGVSRAGKWRLIAFHRTIGDVCADVRKGIRGRAIAGRPVRHRRCLRLPVAGSGAVRCTKPRA